MNETLKPASAESFGLQPEMQPVVDELRRRMKADQREPAAARDQALAALVAQLEQARVQVERFRVGDRLVSIDTFLERLSALLVSPSTPSLEGNEMKYAEDVVITVNGQKFSVSGTMALSYRDVVDLVKVPGMPSMTVKAKGAEGRIVAPGESVMPIGGMVFNVADTSNA